MSRGDPGRVDHHSVQSDNLILSHFPYLPTDLRPLRKRDKGGEQWKTARGKECGKDTGIKGAKIKPACFVPLRPPCWRHVHICVLFTRLWLIPFTALFISLSFQLLKPPVTVFNLGEFMLVL